MECEYCSTWFATHLQQNAEGQSVHVCDKTKCQERAEWQGYTTYTEKGD